MGLAVMINQPIGLPPVFELGPGEIANLAQGVIDGERAVSDCHDRILNRHLFGLILNDSAAILTHRPVVDNALNHAVCGHFRRLSQRLDNGLHLRIELTKQLVCLSLLLHTLGHFALHALQTRIVFGNVLTLDGRLAKRKLLHEQQLLEFLRHVATLLLNQLLLLPLLLFFRHHDTLGLVDALLTSQVWHICITGEELGC